MASSRSKPRRTAAEQKTGGSAASRADQTATIQRLTRLAHAQERAQDYVEVIADLITSEGEARATDVARSLGVTHVTVIRTVARLQKEGLVTTKPYRSIFLTEAGQRLAVTARARHKTVVDFLRSIGVPERAALADAEGIEHHVSADTLAAFERHLAKQEARKGRT